MEQGLAPIERPPEPVIEPYGDLFWVWNAFWRLSNTRPIGFNGPLRIPISEMVAYCRMLSFDYGRRQDLLFYVERMDNVYMKVVEEGRPKPPQPPVKK